mmetsp:Transcript_27469/g.57318  ORF Transcript_27469/g.57318 Transcript_27469/m.57318 type:complete len:118 (-) Transcript_27469:220-573(-)
MGGVADVVVGYTGGKKENPTYQNIMDATEAFMVEFDPSIISYEEILDEWQTNTPRTTHPNASTGLRSSIAAIRSVMLPKKRLKSLEKMAKGKCTLIWSQCRNSTEEKNTIRTSLRSR